MSKFDETLSELEEGIFGKKQQKTSNQLKAEFNADAQSIGRSIGRIIDNHVADVVEEIANGYYNSFPKKDLTDQDIEQLATKMFEHSKEAVIQWFQQNKNIMLIHNLYQIDDDAVIDSIINNGAIS